MRHELSRRAAVKVQKKEQKERKTTEMKLKHLNLDDIHKEFPNLEQNTITDLSDIMSGAVVGRNICHVWYDSASQEKSIFSGRIVKLKKKKNNMYVVGYWSQDETFEDAVDYEMSKFELAADLICEDLMLS